MIAYDIEWDKLEMNISQGGYPMYYGYYLYLIGEWKDWYQNFLIGFEKAKPEYFRFVKMISARFRLVRASCRMLNAVLDFINKPQYIDLEIFMPNLRDRINQIEEMEDYVNSLLDPENFTVILELTTPNGDMRVVEPPETTDVLCLFSNDNFIQELVGLVINHNIHIQEVTEYTTVYTECIRLILEDFHDNIKYWPCWLMDTGGEDACIDPNSLN